MSQYCINCGKKLEDNDSFCSSCGETNKTLDNDYEEDIEPSDDKIRCPKCGSTNVYIDKKGYSAGSGCCGAILFGPLGLLCGQLGAREIEKTCLDCHKKFK